jgi:hypothetical protein
MRRLLYKDVKGELARIAGATGMTVTDARVLVRVNNAIEELMGEGDWVGIVDRYNFVAYDGSLVLPADFERIVGLAADYVPQEVRAPWYEFAADGPGPQDAFSDVDGVLDRGHTATFRQVPNTGGPYFLRVYAEADERVDGVRQKVTVLGYDNNGKWVRSVIDGEMEDGLEIEINGDSGMLMTETAFGWSHIESVIKPATKGEVQFWLWDGEEEYHIATYAPRETRPWYRAYFVPSMSSQAQHFVHLRARRRFQPIERDNDALLISNLNALKSMLQAHRAHDAGDLDEYAGFKAIAVDLLKKESAQVNGKPSRRPAITFSRGFGMQSVSHIQ